MSGKNKSHDSLTSYGHELLIQYSLQRPKWKIKSIKFLIFLNKIALESENRVE